MRGHTYSIIEIGLYNYCTQIQDVVIGIVNYYCDISCTGDVN